MLPRSFKSRGEIDWASLLPPNGVTRWMGFDESRGYIEIEPAAAVPDFTEPVARPCQCERAVRCFGARPSFSS